MANQKMENMLNLALNATEDEREKSQNLGVGFNIETRTWELIVKYVGDISSLKNKYEGISIVQLFGQYAIVTIRENQLEDFSNERVITYIEKSKKLIFSIVQGKIASCVNAVQTAPLHLSGEGVLLALIDSGIDYAHPDFRNEDGTTRIVSMWDQTLSGKPPEGYDKGRLFSAEEINRALTEDLSLVPSDDRDGHGTAVAGIMAGNGRSSNGVNRGVAPKSELIVVKLGHTNDRGFPGTTDLMQGIDFALREAIRLGKPIAINISFGNSYGGHDGQSLLETYIDTAAQIWKNNIIVAAGNDAANASHYSTKITEKLPFLVSLSIGGYEKTVNVQIWKYYGDEIDIEIISPSGKSSGAIKKILGIQRFKLDETEVLLYYGEPSPYNQAQEIYIELLPVDNYITDGIWNIRFIPRVLEQGNIEMWLPSSGFLNRYTGFLLPSPDLTITIPATAKNAITVGAYDEYLDYYADFSGRGFISAFGRVKPEIVAPGVNLMTASVGGGYTTLSGTSFSAPFVAGAAALLMEYGIVRGEEPFLYGEKLKAWLIRGARPLRGIMSYPDIRIGFGALCLKDSLNL